ncbi:MAG TPA: DUF1552 domain-containing protein [Polyangiaceae bacterium]|nr:DUF1552 domain-containing protein [Polyangiaceae bacterium]
MHHLLNRRTLLRGAGVALALPWLESLAPRSACAADPARLRFLPIFLPNGASDNWKPQSQGVGGAWKLSSVLEPLAPLKSKLNVLTNLENGTSFNGDHSSSVEPSHGRQPAAWLSCIDPAQGKKASIDQRIAKLLKSPDRLDSLQVGLSTTFSYCDNNPCENSRSVSWSESGQPLYKLVDPLEVFTKLTGGAVSGESTAEAQKRIAMNKSMLDAVLANANATRAKLGSLDQQRLDQFLTAVREVEVSATQVSSGMNGMGCMAVPKPTISSPDKPINNNNFARQNTADYNKGKHADVMNDLIAMAFQCDRTRVISYMLEDERSEFAYDHVTRRQFSADGSNEIGGTCPEYHNGGQHGDQNDFATITWWNVGKVAALCLKLDAIKEEDGKSILDNSVVFFGACMHGSNHACNELPSVLIGSGGGAFKTDQHIQLGSRWLRDLHHTIMTRAFGMSGPDVETFGIDRGDTPRSVIDEILAT